MAAVGVFLVSIAIGGTISAIQFRRQAQDAEVELYFNRMALANRELTADLPNPGRAEGLLEACPREYRDWEWHYLKRMWRAEPTVLKDRESKEFNSVSFSHDGTRLAAACGDGAIRVWDLATNNQVAILRGHEDYVLAVAFSPVDRNRLASAAADGTIRVWNVETQSEILAPLPGQKAVAFGMAYSVAFSPDGQWLAGATKSAASNDGSVWVRDAATGQLKYELPDHEIKASCVAFSQERGLLASGSWTGLARIWDASTGRLLHVLRAEHIHPVGGLAFSPDGQHLAVGNLDRRIDVWDTKSAQRMLSFAAHSGGVVNGLAFHPDGRRFASASEDRTVKIWEWPSGREVLQLRGHADFCRGVAFSPDGRLLASASSDRTVRLWNATPLMSYEGEEMHTFTDPTHEVWTVAISPDGTHVAAAGLDPIVRVWDSITGQVTRTYSEMTDVVFSLAFSPDGRRLAVAGIDRDAPPFVLKVLDLLTGETVLAHRERHELFATRWSPGGRWLAIGIADASIQLVDATTGRVAFVGKHSRDVWKQGLTFHRDGRRLASASLDGTVKIWELSPSLDLAPNSGESAVLSPSETPAGLAPIQEFGRPGVAFSSVDYSPDGHRLVTGSKDGQLTLWDADTGEELDSRTESTSNAFLSAAYTPNGRWIVTASEDCTAQVYDATNLELVHRFRGHLGPIQCLAISDEFLVTGSADKTVKVWNVKRLEKNPNE